MAQLSDLILYVKTELGEAANSTFAGLPAGTGTNAYTTTSDLVITRLLNDAKDDLFRSAALIRIAGTKSVTAGDSNALALSTLTYSGAKTFRAAYSVTWTPSGGDPGALIEMSWAALLGYYPTALTVPASGTPRYWAHAETGLDSILFDRKPSTNGTLTVAGFGLPADLSGGTDVVAGLPSDRYRALVVYACAMLARQRVDNPQIASRYSAFCREYDTIRVSMRAEIDPALAGRMFGPLEPLSPPAPADAGGGA